MRKSSEYIDDSQRTQKPNSEKFLKFLLKSWIIVDTSAVSALSAARLLAAPEATELNISLLRPDSDPETGERCGERCGTYYYFLELQTEVKRRFAKIS